MDKFLEKGNLSKLNEEEADSLNRPITAGKIAAVIKPLAYRSPGLDIGEFDKTFKEELTPTLLRLFQKIQEEGRLSNSFYEASITLIPNFHRLFQKIQNDGRLPNCFNEINIILIPKPGKVKTKKENYRLIPLMNLDAEFLNKILAIQIQKYIKNIKHHDKVAFIPGM